MPTSPKFSVIVPNYNNGATLARALDSILAQTYPAHEIIVIDDGSSDDSERVAATFKDRVVYFRQANGGVSAARNKGAELATGDWLAFLDADDAYLPDRLRLHADWLSEEPDFDFLLADQESRDADGRFLESFMEKSGFGRKLLDDFPGITRIPLGEADFGALVADGFAEIRTLSLPRHTFLRLGGFPLGHKVGEDLHFFIRLFADSRKGGVVPCVLATYYIYPSSVLRRDPLRAMEAFVESLETLRPEMSSAPPAVRCGYRQKCRLNRLSLAYAYLRVGRRGRAVCSVLPNLVRSPSLATLRDVLSVGRGFKS